MLNFAGWGFIFWRHSLEVGDRIQIGEHRGDVVDIRVFQFTPLEIGNRVDAEHSYSKLTPIVYTSVADSAVLLTLRYPAQSA